VIIFDASYLVVFLNPNPPPAKDRDEKSVEKFKERVEYLAATLDTSNEPIGIPAPAMAEVLVRAGKGRAKYVSILSDRWRFQILPFDSRAAIEASELIAQIKSNSQPWATWAKIKFDIQIVSIAKAENATVIYADDKDIESYAKRLKIPVIRICDLPLPPAPAPEPEAGLESVPMGAQQALNLTSADEKLPENDVDLSKELPNERKNEPETDAPKTAAQNSASVQGSDERRAQGEAAGKTATSRPEETGEEKMSEVTDLYGVCQAEKCKRQERAIIGEADKVTLRGKAYHKGCEPTREELAAKDRSG
jgi:predicted nucleic acid-binding protein